MYHNDEKIILKGTLYAAGCSISPATLAISKNEITLRGFFLIKYQFQSRDIVSIEQTENGEVSICHTLPEYPKDISFSSSIADLDIFRQIIELKFIPIANIDALILRNESPIQFKVFIPGLILLFLV